MPTKKTKGKELSFEEQKKQIADYNIIDDVFFQKVVEDKAASEELIRIILKRDDIKVVSNEPQKYLRNIGNKSVQLDLLCTDDTGTLFNVEIQRSDKDDMQRRMRYNISNLDTRSAETGIFYEDLPDIYAIMISQFDIFNLGKTVYYVDRVVRDYNQIEDNGIHELYINAKGKDITYLSDLMQYIQNSDGYNDKFPNISKRVKYLKEENEGVEKMGKSMEELRAEGRAEGMERGRAEGRAEGMKRGKAEGLAEGFDNGIAEALKVLGISEEEYQKRKIEAMKA